MSGPTVSQSSPPLPQPKGGNAIDVILSRDFAINPKRIDNKNIGCEFCKFREICFYKEEDLVDFPKANYKEFLKEKEEV